MRTYEPHSYKWAARERKARKLADALGLWNVDSEEAGHLSKQGWEHFAAFAEVTPPSPEAVNMTIDVLREREDQARRFSAMMERLPGVGA